MKGRSFTWWELTAVNVHNLWVLIKETVNSLLTSRCRKAIMWMPNKNAAIISTNLLYYLVPHHKEAISILCEGGSFTSLSLLKNAPFQGQVDYSVIHNVSHEVPSRTYNLQNTVTFCMLDDSYPKKKRLFIICYTEEKKTSQSTFIGCWNEIWIFQNWEFHYAQVKQGLANNAFWNCHQK